MFYNCFLDKRADLRKCDPLGAAITGVGSIIGGMINRSTQNDTNKMNLKIARANNESQERIAAANNQTQIDMMRENNDWSANQAELAFNREAEYNSAQAQVARYRDAGLNPAVMMQNSGATSASSSAPSAAGSTIHPSMPNFVTPTMQNPPSVMLDAVNALSQLSASYATYKQAQKTGKETSWIDRLNESTVKNLTADALGKEAKAKFDSVMAQLQETYGHKEIMSRIEKNYAEACSAYAAGELSTANALWADVKRDMESEQLDILRQKRPFIIAEAEETVKLIQQKQNTEKSAQSANYASAEASKAAAKDSLSHVDVNKAEADYKRALEGLTNEQKSQLEDMHGANVRLRKIQAGQAAVDFQFLHSTMEVRKKLLEQSGKLNDQQLKNMEQAYKRAVKENNLFYVNWFLERCDATCRDIGYIAPWKIGSPAEIETNPYGFSEPSSTGF